MGYIESDVIAIKSKRVGYASQPPGAEFAKYFLEETCSLLNSIGYTATIEVTTDTVPESTTSASSYKYAAKLLINGNYLLSSEGETKNSSSISVYIYILNTSGSAANGYYLNVGNSISEQNYYQYFKIKIFYNENGLLIAVSKPDCYSANFNSGLFFMHMLSKENCGSGERTLGTYGSIGNNVIGTISYAKYLDTNDSVYFLNSNRAAKDGKVLMTDVFTSDFFYKILCLKNISQSVTGIIQDDDGNKYVGLGYFLFPYETVV